MYCLKLRINFIHFHLLTFYNYNVPSFHIILTWFAEFILFIYSVQNYKLVYVLRAYIIYLSYLVNVSM